MAQKTNKQQAEPVEAQEAGSHPIAVSPPRRWRLIRPWLFVCLGLLLLAGSAFRATLPSDTVLMTMHNGLGTIAQNKESLPQGFIGAWRDADLMGRPHVARLNWTNLTMAILSLNVYAKWIHAIDLILASLFLVLFLREKKLGWPACWMGLLTAYWLGSNFTLTYAGHNAKFAILMAASLSLWLFSVAVRRRSIAWACLAGGAFGDMFVEQADIALFFAMALSPYFLFSVWQAYPKRVADASRILLPLFVTAGLFAGHTMWTGYRAPVEDAATTSNESSQKKWESATQWSWPPEESIDFIAPGYTGWRSNEPEGAYVGRMGQSAGWEATQQGFRNFKLENQYLGAIPIGLAWWALLVAWRRRRDEPATSSYEVLCWSALAMICFLLACGKYLPFYKMIYGLPAVSSVRNPNMFLQPMQVVLAILAAFGMDALLGTSRKEMLGGLDRRASISFVTVSGIITSLFLVWWLGSLSSAPGIISRFQAEGWSDFAENIASTRIHAIGHGALMLAILTTIVALFTLIRREPGKRVLLGTSWLLVALVAGDVFFLSAKYIKTIDAEQFEGNKVTEFLKKNMRLQRLALTQQNSFYNHWLTFLFPYQGIRTLNLTSGARLGKDHSEFIAKAGRNPILLWQLSGVGYILGPGNLWGEFQRNEATKNAFELHYAYNVTPNGDGSVRVIEATEEQPGRHCVIRFKGPSHRLALVDSWNNLPHENTLDAITAPDFVPFSRVYLSAGDSRATLPPDKQGDGGLTGKIDLVKYKAGTLEVKVSTPAEAILRFADRYNPDWVATIDDEPAPIHRCDNLFMGVHIPAGLHRVELRFKPKNSTLWIQLLGIAVCFAATVRVIQNRGMTTRPGSTEDSSETLEADVST